MARMKSMGERGYCCMSSAVADCRSSCVTEAVTAAAALESASAADECYLCVVS